jgi:hypothetical protein
MFAHSETLSGFCFVLLLKFFEEPLVTKIHHGGRVAKGFVHSVYFLADLKGENWCLHPPCRRKLQGFLFIYYLFYFLGLLPEEPPLTKSRPANVFTLEIGDK